MPLSGSMVWCTHYEDDCDISQDNKKGYFSCVVCGKIFAQDLYSGEPTFEKSSNGQSRLAGNTLRSAASAYSFSRQKILNKGRNEINNIVLHLNVTGGDSVINKAHNLYQIAVERRFSKGRKTSHVAATCIYITCWQGQKAYLLIDFFDYLKISVYVLGAIVFCNYAKC